MKRICSAALLAAMTLTAGAQSSSDNNVSYSGTNSPYSQYGFGELADQSGGFSRGMNGLGLAFREHNQVNPLNPASYSAVDSLTFLFDIGVSGSITNFKEGSRKVNARNADFEYATAAFRAFRHVGVSLGVLPFSNIGYKYSSTDYFSDRTVSSTETHRGSGGLHQVYLGVGWQLAKNFSLGVNGSYLWGDIDRAITTDFSDNSTSLRKYYTATVNSYKVDLGLQYALPLSKENQLIVGLTYSPGHKLGADPETKIISVNSSTSINDTTTCSVSNGLKLPDMFGAGLNFNHKNRLQVGADYQLQTWSKAGFPVGNGDSYAINDDYFADRHKVTVGGQYCKNEYSRKFLERVRYRLGASYTTPYLKINGQDGPKEFSVSAGFSVPIINSWSNRSVLNVSAQWVNQKATDMIDANTFRINIGLTFNERWFAKWKVE